MGGESGFSHKEIANLTGIPYRVIVGGTEAAYLNPASKGQRHRAAQKARHSKIIRLLNRDEWNSKALPSRTYNLSPSPADSAINT